MGWFQTVFLFFLFSFFYGVCLCVCVLGGGGGGGGGGCANINGHFNGFWWVNEWYLLACNALLIGHASSSVIIWRLNDDELLPLDYREQLWVKCESKYKNIPPECIWECCLQKSRPCNSTIQALNMCKHQCPLSGTCRHVADVTGCGGNPNPAVTKKQQGYIYPYLSRIIF